jgi:hypothetical protein
MQPPDDFSCFDVPAGRLTGEKPHPVSSHSRVEAGVFPYGITGETICDQGAMGD